MATDKMTITEICREYGVHANTVRNWLKVGAVSGTKDRYGFWLIPRADVSRLLEKRRQKIEENARFAKG